MKNLKKIVTIADSNISAFKAGSQVFCSPSLEEGTEVTVKNLTGKTVGEGKIAQNSVGRQSGKEKIRSKVVIDNS